MYKKNVKLLLLIMLGTLVMSGCSVPQKRLKPQVAACKLVNPSRNASFDIVKTGKKVKTKIKSEKYRTLDKKVLPKNVVIPDLPEMENHLLYTSKDKIYVYNTFNLQEHVFDYKQPVDPNEQVFYQESEDGKKVYIILSYTAYSLYISNNERKMRRSELTREVGLLDFKTNKIVWKLGGASLCNTMEFLITDNRFICTKRIDTGNVATDKHHINVFDLEKNVLIKSLDYGSSTSKIGNYNAKNASFSVNSSRDIRNNKRIDELGVINLNEDTCRKISLPKTNGKANLYTKGLVKNRYLETFALGCEKRAGSYGCPVTYVDTKTMYVKTLNVTNGALVFNGYELLELSK